MADSSFIPNVSDLAFVEGLYEQYLTDPESVPDDWRAYFAKESNANGSNGSHAGFGPHFQLRSLFDPAPMREASPRLAPTIGFNHAAAPVESEPVPLPSDFAQLPLGSLRPALLPTAFGDMNIALRQDRVDQLVRAFRVSGHLAAKLDPLGLARAEVSELELETYGLSEEDLGERFSSRTIFGTESLTLEAIVDRLRNTYCRSIGVEFMHIHDQNARRWLQDRMEGTANRLALAPERQRQILVMLTDASVLEEFIQKKYVGKKSFSLEGAETIIPLLHLAIDRMAKHGVDEIVLGMAHRGRLNVLANILGKSPREIFREFEDLDPELHRGRGDVKYHLGYSSNRTTLSGKRVHLSLCFNPSHLEFVNPVVLGRVRAKQDRAEDWERTEKAGILIHGDAAFIGEGVVQETLNLSELEAYRTGGTVHVVINNQIGFTTSPDQSRSSVYCTDIAKMLQIPIFHVNGEDPEAVAQVVEVCVDFRAKFQRDVVIDMYCYRRHGHNETDEPLYTQPVLYKAIAQRKSVRDGYLEHLLKLGGVTEEEADRIEVERREDLDRELTVARQKEYHVVEDWLAGIWRGYAGGRESSVPEVSTAVPLDALSDLIARQTELPPTFHAHKNIVRLLDHRREMAKGAKPLDWGTAELLAYATLVTSGIRVRLTGQDSSRGTFAHRHAVLYDQEDGHTYTPLAHLAPDQAPIEIYNSPLSESGVLGFEWGYSLDWPDGLVLWEAQFGDFCNAAQVIIDQFLVSAEDKWKRLSGLVLLVPHGFEGMGPEHSSARLERFLALSAVDNIQVCQPTTPAQHFHLLRRQVLKPWRKPLVVFSPKTLLRHPRATSTLGELAQGGFQRVLADASTGETKRILLCSGKLYYELAEKREQQERSDVTILRFEQLYPLPKEELERALERCRPGTPAIWVQEEPENMGAWTSMRLRLGEKLLGRFPLSVVCRAEASSPATGSAGSHRLEQSELIEKAFA